MSGSSIPYVFGAIASLIFITALIRIFCFRRYFYNRYNSPLVVYTVVDAPSGAGAYAATQQQQQQQQQAYQQQQVVYGQPIYGSSAQPQSPYSQGAYYPQPTAQGVPQQSLY